LQLFLTLALDGGEGGVLFPSATGERGFGTQCVAMWVVTRTSLEKRKFLPMLGIKP
jgi:hypothetical protein